MTHLSKGEKRRALIASGCGRYSDPWHPYPSTTDALSRLLESDGWHVEVSTDPDTALTELDGIDLLVVNAGDPWRNSDDAGGPAAGASEGLDAALDRGLGILAVHSALSTFRDYPSYRRAIGGEWSPGLSWHPPIGRATVRWESPSDEVFFDGPIDVLDELYTDLVVDGDVDVHGYHVVDGTTHPLIWTKTSIQGDRPSRAVVSALGHDARAYESVAYRGALQRFARWAVS